MRYRITETTLAALRKVRVSEELIKYLRPLLNQTFYSEDALVVTLEHKIGKVAASEHKESILKYSEFIAPGGVPFKRKAPAPIPSFREQAMTWGGLDLSDKDEAYIISLEERFRELHERITSRMGEMRRMRSYILKDLFQMYEFFGQHEHNLRDLRVRYNEGFKSYLVDTLEITNPYDYLHAFKVISDHKDNLEPVELDKIFNSNDIIFKLKRIFNIPVRREQLQLLKRFNEVDRTQLLSGKGKRRKRNEHLEKLEMFPEWKGVISSYDPKEKRVEITAPKRQLDRVVQVAAVLTPEQAELILSQKEVVEEKGIDPLKLKRLMAALSPEKLDQLLTLMGA